VSESAASLVGMQRRSFLALAAALACAQPASGETRPSSLLGVAGDPAFLAWVDGYYARALADGWSTTMLSALLGGLSPDPRVLALNASQPEFAIPISDYIGRQATPAVAAMGRRRRDGVPELSAIQATYGVPPDVLVAIWAMESGFGAQQGDMDVVRSLATLAAEDPPRSAWAESQLEACLEILSAQRAPRGRLRGSWAGAMGQTQLIPSVFLETAVSASGIGSPDIWGSSADALASAANLLAKAGWRRGGSWGGEVLLPAGFDVGLSEGPQEPPSWWEARGVRRPDGGHWPTGDGEDEAELILPAGASGPAFLVLKNHFVIRSYNNSLAYALSVGLLADGIGGAGPLARAWPKETPLSLADRMDAQTGLAKLGYSPGPPDGQIGLATRQALRAWQRDHGLPPDGYLTPALVQRLRTSA